MVAVAYDNNFVFAAASVATGLLWLNETIALVRDWVSVFFFPLIFSLCFGGGA